MWALFFKCGTYRKQESVNWHILTAQDAKDLPSMFTNTVLGRNVDVEQTAENRYGTGNSNGNTRSRTTGSETMAGSEDTEPSESHSDADIDILLKSGLPGYTPSYNVPPTKNAIIIFQQRINGHNQFVFETLSFGLVPVWATPKNPEPVNKGTSKGKKYSKEIQAHQAKYFNCRKETLAQGSPVWNSAKGHRCVVPIQGYYEWQKSKTDKLPYYVHSSKDPLVFLAGFYSHNTHYKDNFQDNASGYLSSFTIITGPASSNDKVDLSWLHPRKPLMLKPGTPEWNDWLNPSARWSDDMLHTCLETVNYEVYDSIVTHRVSKDVGNSANQGEYLNKEIKSAKSPQKGIDSFFKPIKRDPTSPTKRPNDSNDALPVKKIKKESP